MHPPLGVAGKTIALGAGVFGYDCSIQERSLSGKPRNRVREIEEGAVAPCGEGATDDGSAGAVAITSPVTRAP